MQRPPLRFARRLTATATLVALAAAACGTAPGTAQGTTAPATRNGAPTQDAAAPPVERLIVLNKAEATASVFDPRTRRELAVIPVGEGPHEVAVSPDGRTAVVCNYGAQQPGSTLTVIDVPALRAVATFALEGAEPAPSPADANANAGAETGDAATRTRTYLRPHGIAFLPDGRHVAVTSEQTRRLLIVDVAERKVARALATPQTLMHMVALADAGRRAFGTSIREGSLSLFDLGPEAGKDAPPPRVVATGAGSEGLAVVPRNGGGVDVWVGNRAADTLSIVDADTATVVAELPTALFPIRVAATPDGAHALVSCAEAGQVQVFDCALRKLVHTIDLLADKTEQSPLPVGICIEPDGRHAWVACMRGEFLAVVDLQTFALVDRVPARAGPDGMAFARYAAP